MLFAKPIQALPLLVLVASTVDAVVSVIPCSLLLANEVVYSCLVVFVVVLVVVVAAGAAAASYCYSGAEFCSFYLATS